MALPTISGTGFLISDGVELQYSKNGTAYARLPLVFKKQRKTDDGWETLQEILIQGTVFGRLAEALTDVVDGRMELRVTGELYNEEYEGKIFTRMNVHSAWPVREGRDRMTAAVATKSDGGDDWPF